MPNDRLLRYSTAAVSFLFFFFYFRYLFGMEIPSIKALNDSAIFVSILSVLLTAPLLGVIVSTIIFQSLYWCIKMKIYFTLPKNRKIEDWILDGFDFRSEEIRNIKALREKGLNKKGDVKYNSAYLYKYFPYYQVKVRKHITGDSLSYLERKLSLFYVHVNILGSMVLALVSALLYSIGSMIHYDWDWSYYKLGGTIILIIYSLGALQIVCSSFYHATEFEHLLLEEALKLEKQPIIDKKNKVQ